MSEQNPHRYERSFTIEQHRDELIERLGNAIKQIAALTAERDALSATLRQGADAAVDLRKRYTALEKERDGLEAQVERIRQPRVYEGATFYTQAEAPEICPDCDGRNFVSYGVRGMVCWTCCLMRDLELAEQQVERLSAPVSIVLCSEEPDTCEGCTKPLRDDEGHETEDMVMLCDDCWQGMLDDPSCHSEECPCDKCIAARTAPAKETK